MVTPKYVTLFKAVCDYTLDHSGFTFNDELLLHKGHIWLNKGIHSFPFCSRNSTNPLWAIILGSSKHWVAFNRASHGQTWEKMFNCLSNLALIANTRSTCHINHRVCFSLSLLPLVLGKTWPWTLSQAYLYTNKPLPLCQHYMLNYIQEKNKYGFYFSFPLLSFKYFFQFSLTQPKNPILRLDLIFINKILYLMNLLSWWQKVSS